jgi:DNA-binding transcriptional LysR family regulator
MSRLETNRSGEMEVFVRVVELGGFSAAARAFRMTPSAVSKLVARLEARLATRLVSRSTRKLQLTAEGCAFYESAVRILADLAEAERVASAGATPRGRVRVNANVPFGMHRLAPLIPEFRTRYPDVTLDVVLTDQIIDLWDERADIAIRTGPLPASGLTARKLEESRMAVVASPTYLEAQGVPRTPQELERHTRIGFTFMRNIDGWPFRADDGITTLPPQCEIQAGDGETVRQLALMGGGIARLAMFHIGPDIAAGRLHAILEDCNPGDNQTVHALFVGGGGHLPARVRVFIDFLTEKIRRPGAFGLAAGIA